MKRKRNQISEKPTHYFPEMGILHLWKVLEYAKRSVKDVSGLANMKLAIDTSIWLVSFMHSIQDSQGRVIENAHLKGLYSRIMRLLSLEILPVFVFDGPTHPLKQRVLVCF